MKQSPGNILVIDFGQLGDVVLSLPALRALRVHFPAARITVLAGQSPARILNLSGYADDVIVVDRVALRDGSRLRALQGIKELVSDIRKRKFDLVIDLHSLSETNILGWLSGARQRLYARRPGRSLDYLSNFRPRPPAEDSTKHAIDRYLDVLLPLGIANATREPHLTAPLADVERVRSLLRDIGIQPGETLVGMFLGAGNPSRKWPLQRFAELARRTEAEHCVRILLLTGPEEHALAAETRSSFGPAAVLLDQLVAGELVALLAALHVLVSNDTGPMHLAAAAGTPVVELLGHPTLKIFTPIGDQHVVVHGATIHAISVDEAYAALKAVLDACVDGTQIQAPAFSS